MTHKRTLKPLIERFNKKYIIDPITGCWNWIAYKNPKGYGQIATSTSKAILAHRVSYELFKGSFPNNLCVLHVCDNPNCVNPDHLFLGTRKDNAEDMISKNRQPNLKGEHSGHSKLTETDIMFIRNYPRYKGYQKDLARKFNISHQHVSAIINRKTWTHI